MLLQTAACLRPGFVVVRDALASLGGVALLATETGKEDLRLTTPDGAFFVVEVKGASGSLKVDDLRQAAHWRVGATSDETPEVRALVVSNPLRMIAPALRIESESFPHSCMERANTLGVAVLSTRQIYEALRREQTGESDAPASLWRALADCRHSLVDFPLFTTPDQATDER